MNILVTGATGFIGSHLVERLTKVGHRVRALASPTSHTARLDFLRTLKVDIFIGDLSNSRTLVGIANDIQVLFHLGAVLRIGNHSKGKYLDVNERGTRNILEAFQHPPERIILMSSLSAMGPYLGTPLDEGCPSRPVDDYGLSKLAQEKITLEYCKMKQIPLVILRPPPVYGPRSRETRRFLRTVQTKFFPFRSGIPCMEYIGINNLVDACMLVLEKGSGIYHVSDGQRYSLNEVLDALTRSLDSGLYPIYIPRPLVALVLRIIGMLAKIFKTNKLPSFHTVRWMIERYWYADISRIESLGYKPSTNLESGMRRTVDEFNAKG